MEQKFNIGEEVKHKSGGPKMIVQCYDPADGEQVTCEWFDNNQNLKEKSFHQDMLKKFEPPRGPIISKITLP